MAVAKHVLGYECRGAGQSVNGEERINVSTGEKDAFSQ
jgi:hypothetical protein